MGIFPRKTSLASFPENDSPRHHISAQKIFLMSRIEKEKKGLHRTLFLKDLDFQSCGLIRFPLVGSENVPSKLETRSRRFALFDRNLIARITSSNRNSKRESPARTKKIMTQKKDSSECQSPHALRSNSSFLTCSSAILRSGTTTITAGITLSIAFFATQ